MKLGLGLGLGKSSVIQTGYSPASIASLTAWYRGDTATAGATFTWTDKAGHGFDATASSNKPTLTNATPSGGQTVHFGGSAILSTAAMTVDSFTYAFTVKGTLAAAAGILFERSTNSNTTTGEYSSSQNTLGSNCHVRRLATAIDSTPDTANLYQDGAWHWVAFTYDAISAGLLCFRDSTTAYASKSPPLSESAAEPLFIGARSGPGFGFTGDVREFVVCNAALTGTDLSDLFTYMQAQIL